MMRRLFVQVVGSSLFVVAFAASGCGTTPATGGGFPQFCNEATPCPAGLTCLSNLCLVVADTVDGGQVSDTATTNDAAVPTDGPAAPDVVEDLGPQTDAGTGTDAGADDGKDTVQDTGLDTVVDATKDAGPDTGPDIAQDVAPDLGPDLGSDASTAVTAMTVAMLQQSDSSQTCAMPTGVAELGKVLLQSVVVTAVPVTTSGGAGKKLQTFYVRPANGPISPSWAGVTIVVQAASISLKPGDVLDITGEYQEFYCLTELFVSTNTDVVVVGKQGPPEPYEVNWTALSPENLEALEGVLVTIPPGKVVDTAVLGSDNKPHGEAMVQANDGTSLAIAFGQGSAYVAPDQKTTLVKNQSYSSVTGHLTYSFGKYLLRLRSDADWVP
jgi:hypothetical protein